jgi:hypothetical protein
MKWKRDPVVYPAIYDSADGRFQIIRTHRRRKLRVTHSQIHLVDRTTGEEFEGFRSLREAKASAKSIATGGMLTVSG